MQRLGLCVLLAALVLVGAAAVYQAPLGALRVAEHQPRAVTPAGAAGPRAGDVAGDVPRDVPQDMLRTVVALASQRSGVALGKLTVIRAEATTWPNSALGCPHLAQQYDGAPTAGYWIVLAANGDLLDYRTTAGGVYLRCDAD